MNTFLHKCYMKKAIFITSTIFILCSYSILHAQAPAMPEAGSVFAAESAAAAQADGSVSSNLGVGSMFSPLGIQEYLVTPGDVYRITYIVHGDPIIFDINVDSTYRVRVANLAVINIKGKTYMEFKKMVESIVIKNYPMSAVQFSMIKSGQFYVFVLGEVSYTSEHLANALTKLSSIVYKVITPYSSIRNVKVTSINGTEKVYDLFKARSEGILKENPYVRPGDIITVQRLDRSVAIGGSVERPGTYQILENENIEEMIKVYGHGLLNSADLASLTVHRNRIDEDSPLGSVFLLDTEEKRKAFILQDRDSISIGDKAKLKPVVYFEGALVVQDLKENAEQKLPEEEKPALIPIQFTPGDNLVSIIRSKQELFSAKSDTFNSYILRNSEKIPINLNRIFYDVNYNEMIEVQPNDRLVVPFLHLFVTVSGAVAKPGRYPYSPDRNWEYYIALAGGFDSARNTGSAVVIKDVYGKKIKKTDPILPETTITAKANSFAYNFNLYAPIITSTAAIVTATVAILTFVYKKDK